MQRFDELTFLSEAAVALTELAPEDDVYRFIAERLARLAPSCLVMTISYAKGAELATVRAVVGPTDMLRRAHEIAGAPEGRVLPVDAQARQVLSEGKLRKVEGGMHQLTFRTFPIELWRRFEEELGIRSVYGQPFARKGDFLGAVAFASRRPSLEHASLIEVFVRLAAVVIQRRQTVSRLRDSERRFRMLAENSRDVIFRLRVSPRLAFEYVSPAIERLLGVTPDQVYEEARRAAPWLLPEAWLSGGAPRELPVEPLVASGLRPDGTQIWTEQNFTAIRDPSGAIVVVEGIARDITKRKEAEAATLETDRRKTEFLAVLSHELRNPLAAVRNGIYLLAHTELREDRARRALAAIERQSVQLTRLIDDLLDMTRITRGKLRLQRESLVLDELVRSTVEDHGAAFLAGEIAVEVHATAGDAVVFADRARLRQIIDNLVHNATKFTPPGGQVSVSVRLDRARGQAVVRVHNTGPPIPRDVLATVFEAFVQADRSLARGKGGLGLGLALVKNLVEMHGGSVEVESEAELGTAFTVRLPLETGALAAARRERPEPVGKAGRRILVVEDNADAADLLRMVLEDRGHVVTIASTGLEALEVARAFGFDVVLCDIGLPAMSGYDVARAIRAEPALRTLPLVALTGYATPDDVQRAHEAGFDLHLSKPPDTERLAHVVAELTSVQDDS